MNLPGLTFMRPSRSEDPIPPKNIQLNNDVSATSGDYEERALLARLELTSFMREAPVAILEHLGGRTYWFSYALAKTPTGIVEGVHISSPSKPCPNGVPQRDILDATGGSVAKILSLQKSTGAQALEFTHKHGSRLSFPNTIEDVLPIGQDYETTLQALGKNTRRNVRNIRKKATTLGINSEAADCGLEELKALAAMTTPEPKFRRINRYEAYIEHAGQPFRSTLRSSGGELISYAAGYMRGTSAYMIYQLNNRDWFELSPALLHRSFLLERFATQNLKELIFVQGCACILRHSCTPIAVEETWLLRQSVGARILSGAMSYVFPPRALTPASRAGLRNFALAGEI